MVEAEGIRTLTAEASRLQRGGLTRAQHFHVSVGNVLPNDRWDTATPSWRVHLNHLLTVQQCDGREGLRGFYDNHTADTYSQLSR